jgi:hypothetical protein
MDAAELKRSEEGRPWRPKSEGRGERREERPGKAPRYRVSYYKF